MKLLDEIKQGEGKHLEFKREMPSAKAIAKTVTAFSNTGGGKLIIGVNDAHNIIGLTKDIDIFKLKDKIINIISDRCSPKIIPEIYTVTITDAILLVVDVFKGAKTPYYLNAEGQHEGVYIRVGASNRKASETYIYELSRQRVNITYDSEIDTHFTLDAIDTSPLSDEFKKRDLPFNLTVMKNLELVKTVRGKDFPTKGLCIILGLYPHISIKCSKFKGTTMDVFIDRKEFTGDVFTQIRSAENFIKTYIRYSAEIKHMSRDDYYEIPTLAIRESIINAICHRDYINEGRDIKIGIYDDMLNIVSPGGLPNTMTESDLNEGRSEIRNKVIAKTLKALGYIEQWGSGIKRIKSSCKTYGLPVPLIKEKGDFIDVEIFRISYEQQYAKLSGRVREINANDVSNQNTVNDMPIKQKTRHASIIAYIKNSSDKRITTHQTSDLLNLGERRARMILKSLADQGVLAKVGTTNNTYYILRTKDKDAL